MLSQQDPPVDQLKPIEDALREQNDPSPTVLPIPRRAVMELIYELESILFPRQHHVASDVWHLSPSARLGHLYWTLRDMIHQSTPHADGVEDGPCPLLETSGTKALGFLRALPEIKRWILSDAEAAFDGDPAARDVNEILLTYPGLYATLVFRLAHRLHQAAVPLLPRMMTEVAHGQTGIDIHPGANIGPRFFIDHGTGVVIGETTVIGERVTLYQGVTLGALNFPHDPEGNIIRGQKRHPTLEDDVVIYSGATILGGDTRIGANSVIGGNVWLTQSVPPFSRVTAQPNIEMRARKG